jgi:hypothetical protein
LCVFTYRLAWALESCVVMNDGDFVSAGVKERSLPVFLVKVDAGYTSFL